MDKIIQALKKAQKLLVLQTVLRLVVALTLTLFVYTFFVLPSAISKIYQVFGLLLGGGVSLLFFYSGLRSLYFSLQYRTPANIRILKIVKETPELISKVNIFLWNFGGIGSEWNGIMRAKAKIITAELISGEKHTAVIPNDFLNSVLNYITSLNSKIQVHDHNYWSKIWP